MVHPVRGAARHALRRRGRRGAARAPLLRPAQRAPLRRLQPPRSSASHRRVSRPFFSARPWSDRTRLFTRSRVSFAPVCFRPSPHYVAAVSAPEGSLQQPDHTAPFAPERFTDCESVTQGLNSSNEMTGKSARGQRKGTCHACKSGGRHNGGSSSVSASVPARATQ